MKKKLYEKASTEKATSGPFTDFLESSNSKMKIEFSEVSDFYKIFFKPHLN
jgi:hypothetical protein